MKKKLSVDKEIGKHESQIRKLKNLAWSFVIIGVLFFLIGLYLWFVDSNSFNEVGDFIGGISGSLWTLSGLFFIYVAFLGQKVEIKLQQEDLKLTREELRGSREVFKKQASIMHNQLLDATFFNLLDNHRKQVDSFKKGKTNYVGNGSFYNILQSGYETTEVVSGYDVIEQICNNVKNYFSNYSEYLRRKKIFDSRITETNPINYLLRFSEIKLLFFEVLNILVFIEEKVKIEENKEFYYNILSSNLTKEEKFLIEAFNINCIHNKSPLLHFGIYDECKLHDFKLDRFIGKRFIKLAGRYDNLYSLDVPTQRDDIRIVIDNASNYEKILLYYVDNEKKHIEEIAVYEQFEGDIFISKALLELAKNKLENIFNNRSNMSLNDLEFNLMVQSIDKFKSVEVFYYYKIGFSIDSKSNGYIFIGASGDNPKNWVKEYFI